MDILRGEFLNHQGNGSFYGATPSGGNEMEMSLPPSFVFGAMQQGVVGDHHGEAPIDGGSATTTAQWEGHHQRAGTQQGHNNDNVSAAGSEGLEQDVVDTIEEARNMKQAWQQQAASGDGMQMPRPQMAEALKCPRCDSSNTKFCYYNSYNMLQPRYFCKACRRYWTHGGTFRNVPVGVLDHEGSGSNGVEISMPPSFGFGAMQHVIMGDHHGVAPIGGGSAAGTTQLGGQHQWARAQHGHNKDDGSAAGSDGL
ncbi:hypothetical protein EJB05_26090, partial [Eragrostis curvula]